MNTRRMSFSKEADARDERIQDKKTLEKDVEAVSL